MGFEQNFEHRDDLLDAAIDEFCASGYDKASINRILDEAGMSKGQFYYHFNSKQDLYMSLVGWVIDEKRSHFAASPPPVGDGFFDTLRKQIEAGAEFATNHPAIDRFSRSVISERANPIFLVVSERFRFDPDGDLGALVAHYHEQGAFRDDVPLEMIQAMATGMVNHLPELIGADSSVEVLDGLDFFIESMRRSLGSDSPA